MTPHVRPIDRIVTNLSMWREPLHSWRTWLLTGAPSAETVRLRTYQLGRFADDHRRREPFALTVDDLGEWLSAHDWGAESMRSYRAALRSFYGWAHATGRTGVDPSRLLRKIKPTRPQPRPAPEHLIDDALGAAAQREWLILMLGSREGMRRGEIARVHSRDLIAGGSGGSSLYVHGKGDKERVIPLLPPVADALMRCDPGWVFPNGAGTHVTPAHIGVLARRALRGASTHQLRHRFATVTYTATHDIRAVQELLGHASVATTQIYTAVDTSTLRAVMQAAA